MVLSSNVTLWSNSDLSNQTKPSLGNDTDCKLPWENFLETSNSNSHLLKGVTLVSLLLILVFDTFLIAIILLNDHLRKKASISGHISEVTIFLQIEGLTCSNIPILVNLFSRALRALGLLLADFANNANGAT